MIRNDDLARSLYAQISALPTVDAHEHLHAEGMRLERQVDIFLLFHQYLHTQLTAAGMPEADADALGDETTPLDQKWASLAPYLDHVRHTGCARPAFEALRRFFGEEDLTADNHERLTERMRAHNQPGLFDHCLREACGIALVLNQNQTMWQNDLFRPILPEDHFLCSGGLTDVERLAQWAGEDIPPTLERFLTTMEQVVTQRVQEGMVGVKGVCYPHIVSDAEIARSAYAGILAGHEKPHQRRAFVDYIRDQLYEVCGRLGIVVVKHSGVWAGGWSDHTNIRPTNLFSEACMHRQTRFDLFHAGTPVPGDTGLLARGLPNVWLNLCWSHLISPAQSVQALDLWLDEVPVNKIIGFGGDYWWAVENVYGSLVMAREVIALALAKRVREGCFSEARALEIARLWLHDNPREAYRV
jgi:hypothetical protein